MQPKPPARVPLLWILLPLILGIALGRLLPIGPYYLLVVPSLTLGTFAWKVSDRYPPRRYPRSEDLLLPLLAARRRVQRLNRRRFINTGNWATPPSFSQ